MTKRDFFRVVIKLFGLYSLVITLFTIIPQNISNIYAYGGTSWMLFMVLGTVLLVCSLFFVLLFKTDFIIEKLDLDKGFDEDIIILGEFKNEQIFKTSILIIGFYLIVNYFPNIIFEMLNIFKTESSGNSFLGYKVDYYNLIISILNFIIGIFLITNYKQITAFLDKK